MNLNAVVAGAVGAVNPQMKLTVRVSVGARPNADASRTPLYAEPITVWGQFQPMSYSDIQQAEGLNIQGVRGTVYLNGSIEGLIRGRKAGGDLITTPDGAIWKVALVTEAWPDWTTAIVTLQDGS